MRATPCRNRNYDGIYVASGRLRYDRGLPGWGLERLQFFSGFETHSFAGRYADFLPGARVAADAGLARADVEHAEAAQLDAISLAQSAFHGLEYSLDGLLRLRARHASLVYYSIYDVELNHTSLHFPYRPAMLVRQLRVVKVNALG